MKTNRQTFLKEDDKSFIDICGCIIQCEVEPVSTNSLFSLGYRNAKLTKICKKCNLFRDIFTQFVIFEQDWNKTYKHYKI